MKNSIKRFFVLLFIFALANSCMERYIDFKIRYLASLSIDNVKYFSINKRLPPDNFINIVSKNNDFNKILKDTTCTSIMVLFYEESFFVDYDSFANTGTSNFEYGGERGSDRPWLCDMDDHFFCMYRVYKVDSEITKEYCFYKNGELIETKDVSKL